MAGDRSWGREIFVGVAVAVLVGTSSPWWWEKLFDDETANSSATTHGASATAPSSPAGQPSATFAPEPQATSPIDDGSQCVITISNPFASINETPEHQGQESASVPAGSYTVIEVTTTEFAGRDERWFKIQVGSRVGWITDDTILIESKSSACP